MMKSDTLSSQLPQKAEIQISIDVLPCRIGVLSLNQGASAASTAAIRDSITLAKAEPKWLTSQKDAGSLVTGESIRKSMRYVCGRDIATAASRDRQALPALSSSDPRSGSAGAKTGGTTKTIRSPAGLRIVFVVPPVFAPALPERGSDEDRAGKACLSRLAAVAMSRPHTYLIDLRIDSPVTRDPASFWDVSHFGSALARVIESRIAAVLAADAP